MMIQAVGPSTIVKRHRNMAYTHQTINKHALPTDSLETATMQDADELPFLED